MTVSRRNFIRAAGGVGLALIGIGGLFTVSRTPNRAIAPWDEIKNTPHKDIRLDAFRHAILAPNPHNRQPWLIQLVGKDEALITCDLNRRLPMTDPFDRQILIGFGCFIELASIAARERGVQIETTLFPEGEPGERLDNKPIARMRFIANPVITKDPLYPHIIDRRTNKKPFDTLRPVGIDVLAVLASLTEPGVSVKTSLNSELIKKLRTLTWKAWMIELDTARTWQETVDLMRIGKAEIEANPDGVSITGATLEALALAGVISREQMVKKGSDAYNTSIKRYQPIMSTGMAYAWIVTEGNSRSSQIAAGKAYVRMNLESTRLGLGFHPVSQALQEFPEMSKAYGAMHAKLSARGNQRVQMLVRLGYGNAINPTPRWPVESKLI
jgi:hypothetical protein